MPGCGNYSVVMALVAYLEQCWREQGTLPPLTAE